VLCCSLCCSQAVEGDFKLFAAANTPMGSSDSVLAPHARLDDGLLHVTYNQDMGRLRATQILLQLESEDVGALPAAVLMLFMLHLTHHVPAVGGMSMLAPVDTPCLPYCTCSIGAIRVSSHSRAVLFGLNLTRAATALASWTWMAKYLPMPPRLWRSTKGSCGCLGSMEYDRN